MRTLKNKLADEFEPKVSVKLDIPIIPKGGDYAVFSGSNEKGTRIYETFKNRKEVEKYALELRKKGEEGITIDAYDADGDLFGKSVNVNSYEHNQKLPTSGY